MKFSYSQISYFSTPESGVSIIPYAPSITQVYAQRSKNLLVNIDSVQTMQDHETCVSPVLLLIPPIIVEYDEATKSREPTPSDPPTLTTTSLSSVSDIDLPIALRKEPHNYPSIRYPLDHFCTYANLSTDHLAFTTRFDSYSIPKNVTKALQHP
jgi:hypothetical protein